MNDSIPPVLLSDRPELAAVIPAVIDLSEIFHLFDGKSGGGLHGLDAISKMPPSIIGRETVEVAKVALDGFAVLGELGPVLDRGQPVVALVLEGGVAEFGPEVAVADLALLNRDGERYVARVFDRDVLQPGGSESHFGIGVEDLGLLGRDRVHHVLHVPAVQRPHYPQFVPVLQMPCQRIAGLLTGVFAAHRLSERRSRLGYPSRIWAWLGLGLCHSLVDYLS